MTHRLKYGLVACAIATLAWTPATSEEVLDFSFNGDSARLAFAQTLRNRWATWDAAWARHQDDGNAGTLGFYASGPIGNAAARHRGTRLGFGVKAAYYTLGGENGLSLALGGQLLVPLPRNERVFFRGAAYVAPGALSVLDGDSYHELHADAGFRLLRRIDLYTGLRSVRGKFDDGAPARAQRGFYFGVAGRF